MEFLHPASMSVRLSVSLSVTFRYSVEIAKRILKLSGYPHHFSFSTPNGMEIFRRGPPDGVVEYKGHKNRDFRPST